MPRTLKLNELVKAIKSVAPDKSNTVTFSIEAGKKKSSAVAKYLMRVDMEFDASTSWQVKKGILADTFIVTVGGVNSEVRKTVQDILKTIQNNI